MRNMWRVRLGVVALVAVLAFGAVGSAIAQGPDAAPRDQSERLPRELLDAVVEATGLSAEDVMAQLREGKTLAEICTANGVDPQTVIDTVKAARTAQIQQALADGTITQQQADRRIARLDDVLERAMNAQLPDRPLFQHPLKARAALELVQITSEQTGLAPHEILNEMSGGETTLADIATEHGIDPDAISAQALARTTDTLRAAVQAGKITQNEMDTLVAEAGEFYPQAMTQPLPARLDRPTPVRDRLQDRLENSLIGALADAAGVEPRDILREVLQPHTLAEVAAAHGVDVDTLISAAEANITEAVNQAIADDRLTQAQADQLLEELHDRLAARVNGELRRPAGTWF